MPAINELAKDNEERAGASEGSDDTLTHTHTELLVDGREPTHAQRDTCTYANSSKTRASSPGSAVTHRERHTRVVIHTHTRLHTRVYLHLHTYIYVHTTLRCAHTEAHIYSHTCTSTHMKTNKD